MFSQYQRIIFHIDVNNAFLSWTALERLANGETLDIRTIPSAIVGDSDLRHGIILAKSTPAKKFGIATAEPTGMALQKCPDLFCVPPSHSLYSECSRKMFDILEQYSDRVEQFSIDEGFIDYTGMEQLLGPPLETAQEIKDRIFDELGFTVNIGVSSNKYLAKMAGELEKPNKLITLFPHEMAEKLWPLPIGEMFMVGRKTVPKMKKIGISTIGDLAKYPLPLLEREFKSQGRMMHAYANGIDDTPVALAEEHTDAKSVSNSTTLPYDVTDREDAFRVLLALSENVAARLRKHHYYTQEIAITIRTDEFISYSHQRRLLNAIDCTNAVYETAKEVFEEAWKGEPIRLLSVRAGQICSDDFIQLSITDEDWSKQKKADEAMDKLRKKYGSQTVKRTTLLNAQERATAQSMPITYRNNQNKQLD